MMGAFGPDASALALLSVRMSSSTLVACVAFIGAAAKRSNVGRKAGQSISSRNAARTVALGRCPLFAKIASATTAMASRWAFDIARCCPILEGTIV